MCFNRPSSPTVFPQPASLSHSPFCQPLSSAEHAVYPAYPYEADPMICPLCQGEMRVITVIHDRGVIRRILEHLKL